MGPSRSNHPNNDIETEIRHSFTTAESALKFLTYRALFLCKTLYLQYLKLVARNWKSQGDRGAEIRGPLYPGLVFKKKNDKQFALRSSRTASPLEVWTKG